MVRRQSEWITVKRRRHGNSNVEKVFKNEQQKIIEKKINKIIECTVDKAFT